MEMRCRRFWWGDYNPRTTMHYLYDKVETRDDVGFLATTFLDNPYISKNERRKILSYEPTHPEDRLLIQSKRRPHPTNIKNGTADDYMWNVYGLGLPSSPEGLIFQHVTWIKEWPDSVEKIYYGNDFGWENNPTAIVKVGQSGRNLYLQKMFYEPTASTNQYLPMLEALPKGFNGGLVADPGGGGAGMISEARRKGFRVLSANKFAGSILYGIGVMKKFKIHIVDCPEWRKEQANYKRRIVNGVKLDEPVDAFNDLWDAARYVALTFLRNK
jgi:phage terminase large subunit